MLNLLCLNLVCNVLASIVEQVEHILEAFRAAVVRIGNAVLMAVLSEK